jgi:molybdate/tungstate transport system substrate-binding protein
MSSAWRRVVLSAMLFSSPTIQGSGSVHVMYAGSLTRLFEKNLGPAFQTVSGFTFQGEGKGSVAIANLMRGGVKTPDVFISADPAVDQSLHGKANGDFVSWWVPFARTELVIAWSPKSHFRAEFEAAQKGSRSWESVMEQPGFHLGRTDPELDPKGYRTLFLFQLDEERTGEQGEGRRILGPPDNAAQIFPEEQLVARIQIGEIDAGVFYLIEAIEAGLPHLRLPAAVNQGDAAQSSHYARASYTTKKGATVRGSPILYTVTIPNRARNREGAESFVQFLLSPAGEEILSKAGLLPVSRAPQGIPAEIPSRLKPYLATP